MRLLLCLLLLSVPAFAQEEKQTAEPPVYPTLEPDIKVLKRTGQGYVDKAIDPLRLSLKDGRIIQLMGLDIPDLFESDPGPISVAGKELLDSLFQEKKIQIYQNIDQDKGRENRMGYQLAHITRQEDNVWAQGALLSSGLARVRSEPDNRQLVEEMYEIEQEARKKTLSLQEEGSETALPPAREAAAGEENPSPNLPTKEEELPNLWQNELYRIYTPETVQKAPRAFQIVEGTIKNAAIVKNRIYLNFGDNWKTDFTVSIGPEARRLFSKEGYNPLQWSGKTVRVRGWIEDYNGPYIDLDHVQRIEFISDK
jgi:hypothetical protein